MYLHICKNVMIKTEDIVGIFNYNNIEKTKEYQDLINNHKLEALCDDMPKSFILVKEDDEHKGYLSNISVSTLEKRAKIGKGEGGKYGKI